MRSASLICACGVAVGLCAHARVAPATYPLDSFEACYQRVLEIWRQIPALVDEDKLEAIGVIQAMYSNWPERCQTELEPGDGYPAKAVLQFWIARYKEKAEWWGLAIPEYEKALAYLHEKTRPYRFPWERAPAPDVGPLTLDVGSSATPAWVLPVRRGVQRSLATKAPRHQEEADILQVGPGRLAATNVPAMRRDPMLSVAPHSQVSSFEFQGSSSNKAYNASWVVYILRGLARSHAHLDQEKIAERHWQMAWHLTPNCPKLLSEYNCWRAEFLYRRAAPNKVEIYETAQYVLTNGVNNPLLREAEQLCRAVFAVYPQPQRRLYHTLGQVLWAQSTPANQAAAIDLWLDGLKLYGVIPRFVEQEWLLKDLQMSVPSMSPAQRARYLATLDAVVKSIPAVQENVAAIAFVMNQMGMMVHEKR